MTDERLLIEHSLHRRAERLPVLYAVAPRRSHSVIGENHEVITASTGNTRHPPDLGDTRVRAPEVRERGTARRSEMMRELVVLHERAVDHRNAKVDVEQNRHRLKLPDDDVGDNPDERENPFRVSDSSGQLPPRALPFLPEPFDNAFGADAQQSQRMQ